MSPIVPMTAAEPPKRPVVEFSDHPRRPVDLEHEIPVTKVIVTGMTLVNSADRSLVVDNPNGVDHATVADRISRTHDAEDLELDAPISAFDN